VVITREIAISGTAGIGQPDVGEAPTREFIDAPAVGFDPGAGSESLIACNRHDGYKAGALYRGVLVEPYEGLPALTSPRQAVELGRRRKRPAIHFENVVTLSHLNARDAQRSLELRIPVLAAVYVANAVMAVLHCKVGSEQSDGDRLLGRQIAGANEVGMA